MRLGINLRKYLLLAPKIILGLVILVIAFGPLSPNQTFHAQAATAKKCVSDKGLVQDPLITGGCPIIDIATGQKWELKDVEVADVTNLNAGAGAQLGYYVAQIIYVFTVGLGSAVAYVAANVLNLAVHISLDSAAYGLDFISLGWTMLRDIANMAFIFILIYIAMKVMFEAHTAGTIGLLAKVLAVALVINFSFFATRLVIDAGNLISVQFYNAVVAEAPNATVQPIAGVNTVSTPDITAKIMGGVNFQSALNVDSFGHIAEGSVDGGFGETFIAYSFIYIVLGAMLFMLAAAFIAAGVKFIVRIVMLWFAIVTAPIALVAWSFQGGGHGGGHGGGYFSKWSKNLVSHAFYPAVFLFVMLLISNFMSASGDAGFGGGLVQSAINNGQVGSLQALGIIMANIAVRLGFVIVMLYFALKASDYFEVVGAGVAKTWGQNLVYGGTGWLMRGTFGRGANYINTKFNTDEAGKSKSRVAATLLNIPAKQSFNARDLRQTLKPVGDALDKRLGSAAGKGGWAGYAHEKDEKDKKAGEQKVKDMEHAIEHHMGGPKEEAAAQAAFREGYEGGAAAFDARVNQLTLEIRKSREKSIELAKNQARATTKDAKDQAARDFKKNQDDMRASENQLKVLTGMGKRVVESQNKEHAQKIAIDLISSGNKTKYIVAQKILSKDSKEAKLAKAVKDYGEGEEGGATPPTPGAAPSPAHVPANPGGHGPVVPPSIH